ncbi:hypothetical protein RIF29_24440 [Crotalaria pallida]|uniref:Uncharacterized protein n=1 Tax=Crotalaria pallida TaxID=3830 RepID=A0AAN9EKD2_CROPI
MAFESIHRQHRSSSNQSKFLICILLVSISLLLLVIPVKRERSIPVVTHTIKVEKRYQYPFWFEVIAKGINSTNNIKVGLVNVDGHVYKELNTLYPKVETVSIHFDHVNRSLKRVDFFPEWIDEEGKPKCPEMPMPRLKDYRDLNVVVAKVPCGQEGNKDLFRLQVNLVVANLAVENGWEANLDHIPRKVYVVFVGPCDPMIEIFRCDDLLLHQGEYWVYQPDLRRLRQQTLMPVGSCEVVPSYSSIPDEVKK